MGLLKFIGGVFLFFIGLILLYSTIPTFLVGTVITPSLTKTLLIVLIEAIVGIIMFASGIYISITEILRGGFQAKTERKKEKPVIETKKEIIEKEKPKSKTRKPISLKGPVIFLAFSLSLLLIIFMTAVFPKLALRIVLGYVFLLLIIFAFHYKRQSKKKSVEIKE